MDIIILNSSTSLGVRTIGAYRTADELRKNGFTVKVIDFVEYLTENGIDDLIYFLKKYMTSKTLWVGVSSTWCWKLREVRKGEIKQIRADIPQILSSMLDIDNNEADIIRKLIKSISPNCKIVCGGARAFNLQFKNFFDVYLLGYSEIQILDFTKWLIGKNPFFQYKEVEEKIVIDYDVKADSFDFVNSSTDWSLENLQQGEALPIEIARGCIFKCKFCSFMLNGKKKNDYIRDPKIIYSDIMRNYDLSGTTYYILSDDTYNDNVEKMEMLYEQVWSKLPFKISFSCYLRLDLLAAHPKTIDLLLASGLHATFFGIESLNNETTKIIGKGITSDRIISTLALCRDVWGDNVRSSAGFIIGLPKDTEESINKWLELIYDPKFPLDSKVIYPLYIGNTQTKVWLSDFERSPEKYGYILKDHGVNSYFWKNTETGMTYEKAADIAATAFSRLGVQHPSGFENTAIKGMGASYDNWKTDLASKFKIRRDLYWNSLRNE